MSVHRQSSVSIENRLESPHSRSPFCKLVAHLTVYGACFLYCKNGEVMQNARQGEQYMIRLVTTQGVKVEPTMLDATEGTVMFEICFAVDENYHLPAAVAAVSVARVSKRNDLRFWFISQNTLNPKIMGCLENYFTNSGNAEVKYINFTGLTNFGKSGFEWVKHVNETMYLRLYIPEVIDVSRYLYLDADVLCVNEDIDLLADVNLQDNTIGAVQDAWTFCFADSQGGLPGLRSLKHINPTSPYFNTGMMSVDVERWRERNITSRSEKYLVETTIRRYPDQDALNVALYNDWLELPSRFNEMRGYRYDNDCGSEFGDRVIFHSAGKSKPWHLDYPGEKRRMLFEKCKNDLLNMK